MQLVRSLQLLFLCSNVPKGNLLHCCQFLYHLTLFKVVVRLKDDPLLVRVFFWLYCAKPINFHLQACLVHTGLFLNSDEVLVIVCFVCLSNEQFVVFKISKAPLVTLGLSCIYFEFQQIVASLRVLVHLWFMASLMVFVFAVQAFTLARLLCMSVRLHWLQMSPAAQVGSKPHGIRQRKTNKPSPGVSLLEME